MTPERWRQVTRIYGAVLTKPSDVRAAALLELCPDDEALRKEVESLLADGSTDALRDQLLGEVASALVDQDLSGRTLGPYRLESTIGAGGMGQVYRANDTRLHRTVAIKVLAPSLAHDSQFRARFDREAKAIAALNHAHICTLYDIGSSEGIDYLVMEYVEGETLSARLERGAVPFDQALTTAIQIAEALAAAHRTGIVHRDLKPGNVMLTKSGVKLLDFGLARLRGDAASARPAGPLSMLPTTPPAGPTRGAPLTVQGTILGTLQYMAPEQLEGKEADARTDLFAFGAIVYEMFTGKRAFSGTSQASLIGAIMHIEPPSMSADQPLTPASLERVVKTCLAKPPDDRWQTAHDLARELRWIAAIPPGTTAPISARQSKLPWAIAGTALIIASALAGLTGLRPDRSAPTTNLITRFSIANEGPTAAWFGTPDPSIAVTRDGSKIFYLVNSGSQLLARSIDQIDPVMVATGTLRSPFVSWDGRWVGFVDGLTFKRVATTGGAPVSIGAVPLRGSRGTAWMPDDTLIFATNDNETGLMRMAALGSDGRAEILTRPDAAKGEADHVWPAALPDGSVLFTITALLGGADAAQVAIYDPRTNVITPLIPHASQARYVSSGHIVYGARGSLFAVPFDLKRHQVTGPSVSMVQGIRTTGNGSADYAVSAQGTLAYIAGAIGGAGPPRKLVWVDRSGNEQPISPEFRTYQDPRLSPDGLRIAIYCADQQNDIWIWDTRLQRLDRFTSEPSVEQSPVWTRDGKRIIFSSDRGPVSGVFNLWWKSADDPTQKAERLTDNSVNPQYPESLSPDGNVLIFRQAATDLGRHLMKRSLPPNEGSVTEVLQSSQQVRNGELSPPDGRWLAFESDISGSWEVYVRSLREGDTSQHTVSIGGGRQPRWSSTGKELFFFGADGALLKVDVSAQTEWRPSTPVRVVAPGYYTGSVTGRFDGRQYDVAADGRRFLMIKPQSETAPPSIVIEQHFDEELKARVPSK